MTHKWVCVRIMRCQGLKYMRVAGNSTFYQAMIGPVFELRHAYSAFHMKTASCRIIKGLLLFLPLSLSFFNKANLYADYIDRQFDCGAT